MGMIHTGPLLEKSRIPGMGGLFIVYKGSARKEAPGYRGISHLAEHLLCKSYEHLNTQLEANGVVANAYTSDEDVVFFWTGLDEKIELFQEELLNLMYFTPTEEQFSMEKNIVIQEYNIAISNQFFILENIPRKYLNYFSAIGKLEDIQELTYENFLTFLEEKFRKPTSIIRLGESENFKDLTRWIKYEEYIAQEPLTLTNLPENVVESAKFPASKLISDWRVLDKERVNHQDIQFINAMWANGLNSPMYQEVREKAGLSYGLGFHTVNLDDKNTINYFWCMCNPDKEEEVRKIVKNTLDNWETFMSRDRFDTILNYMKSTIKVFQLTQYDKVTRFTTNDYTSLEYLEELTYEKIIGIIKELAKTEYNQASIADTLVI